MSTWQPEAALCRSRAERLRVAAEEPGGLGAASHLRAYSKHLGAACPSGSLPQQCEPSVGDEHLMRTVGGKPTHLLYGLGPVTLVLGVCRPVC